MPIDPSIALGVRPPQFADPLQQYGNILAIQNAGNKNALSQYTLARAKREDEDTNALRRELAGVGALDSPEGLRAAQNALMRVGRIKEAQELGKSALDTQKTMGEIKKQKIDQAFQHLDMVGRNLASVQSDEQAVAIINSLTETVPQQRDAVLAQYTASRQAGKSPQQVAQEIAASYSKHALDKIKAFAPDIDFQRMGTTLEAFNKNPLAGPVGQMAGVPSATIGMTHGERESARHNPIMEGIARGNLGVAQGNLGVNQQRFLDSRNPVLQSKLSAASAEGGAMGKARAELAIDPIVAAASAKKILSAVNYDAATGTDDISKLIKKSTSGILQNVVAQGIGATLGSATSGREAIGQLTTEANKLTMDLMGGKLGTGISNADRDFVLGQLGDVANANTPANERLAAWNRAMGRLKSIATTSGQTQKPAGNPYANKTDAEIRKELGL